MCAKKKRERATTRRDYFKHHPFFHNNKKVLSASFFTRDSPHKKTNTRIYINFFVLLLSLSSLDTCVSGCVALITVNVSFGGGVGARDRKRE
jgi:hypothetical protein